MRVFGLKRSRRETRHLVFSTRKKKYDLGRCAIGRQRIAAVCLWAENPRGGALEGMLSDGPPPQFTHFSGIRSAVMITVVEIKTASWGVVWRCKWAPWTRLDYPSKPLHCWQGQSIQAVFEFRPESCKVAMLQH